jgi:Protein of unknown function (DUF4240)
MTTINFPLRTLNDTLIRDLKEKYPEAEIKIELHPNLTHTALSEAHFWEIMDTLDWENEEDNDAVIEPAIAYLSTQPVRHIFEFADILSEKLYALDARKYAQNIGEDAWKSNRYFSVDNFLYTRCCVVANGKSAFQEVLKNPLLMPKDRTFEDILYIASSAYTRKMSKKYNYAPTYPIETYSNKEGWQ